jgi:hypothetical protein
VLKRAEKFQIASRLNLAQLLANPLEREAALRQLFGGDGDGNGGVSGSGRGAGGPVAVIPGVGGEGLIEVKVLSGSIAQTATSGASLRLPQRLTAERIDMDDINWWLPELHAVLDIPTTITP